ncbi:thioredoxin family protein [Myceligenerans pegani]|uniref:Thioredoxin family protein n=1 Tax=Myceligenerans pegani TaxID=2776917 RepID=A0ABR9N2F3_9MICO|nr:thioredoxin family protein [Myceligenerans sp. TRM 65318]MBE1877283.1 thioredoxin family protein [Myceligenerans sp. TRM 65318]MBE3019554.1 thioredoxin family protein [Myceligenerans sp. TRM 65318]
MEILLLSGAVVLTALVGVSWSRRQGAVRGPRAADGRVDWASHGVDLGTRATFVQFTTQVCAACRSTARVLGTQAGDGVVHHELDVEDHLALTGRLAVLRTPTVLVLDRYGTEVARMSGGVSPAQAREALARATSQDHAAPPEHGTTADARAAVAAKGPER